MNIQDILVQRSFWVQKGVESLLEPESWAECRKNPRKSSRSGEKRKGELLCILNLQKERGRPHFPKTQLKGTEQYPPLNTKDDGGGAEISEPAVAIEGRILFPPRKNREQRQTSV